MTSHDSGDDGDPDDAQLRSLRAVWLAMPDEDPPERGLAELMAAARVKAEAMAKPSLLQRIVALLRRPPVLALATVMVFIGGAILIGNRTKDASEAPPAGAKLGAPQLEQNAKEDQASAGSAAPPSGEAAKSPETIAEPPGEPAQLAPAEPPPPPAVERPHGDHRAPAHTQPAANAQVTTGTVKGTKTSDRFEAKDKAKREDTVVGGAPVRDVKNGLIEGDLTGEDRGTTRGSFDDEAPREASQAETVTAAPAKDTTATTTDSMRPTSRASQYVAQAKSALARGDCTAAKALMKRVAAEDTGLYKKTLAADPLLDKCVRK